MDGIIQLRKEDKTMNNVMAWRLSAVAIVLFSATMASALSKVESAAGFVACHAKVSSNYAGLASAIAADDAAKEKLQDAKDILRDSFLLAWMVGGVIPGGCVGVWIRSLTKMAEIGKTFGVSVFTSFCSAPYLITKYFETSPSTCLLVGFMVSVCAWVGWEIALICTERMRKAAQKYGWIGVAGEITGHSQDVTGVTVKPSETPNVPGADGETL
jgi:hypothetical protein